MLMFMLIYVHIFRILFAFCGRKILTCRCRSAEVVGAVEEVIANKEVDHKQDENEENLRSEGEEEVKGDEEGHLVDDEDCPGD